ncbi:hypothetical protein OAG71_02555 [bacterium]|nr:hypothetical protein [bacterium]
MAAVGTLLPKSLVRKVGTPSWSEANTLKGLDFKPQVPPPITIQEPVEAVGKPALINNQISEPESFIKTCILLSNAVRIINWAVFIIASLMFMFSTAEYGSEAVVIFSLIPVAIAGLLAYLLIELQVLGIRFMKLVVHSLYFSAS